MTSRWQWCRALEEAGGLLPANWLWLEEPGPSATILGAAQARKHPQPGRLLTHPGSPRQRCYPYQGEFPGHDDWILLVGQAAGPNRWEQRPLYGRRLLLTRQKDQAEPLAERLRELGAEVVVCPLLEFVPPDDPQPLRKALGAVGNYDWLMFTSPNGVRGFWRALWESGGDARSLGRSRLAAIGPGTAATLQEYGLRADVVPARSLAEGLLEALESCPMEGQKVLLARAQEAREVLPDGLRERGAEVEVVAVYKTVAPQPPTELAAADLVILMSSSSVRHFRELSQADVPCLCIGPITAQTARESGFSRIEQARRFDLEGVIEAILDWARSYP